MMFMMTFLWLFLLVAVAAVVVWLVREFGPRRPPTDDPLAILDQRCARGEMNQEQYEARRQVLSRRSPLL